jgi:hypothetical protein
MIKKSTYLLGPLLLLLLSPAIRAQNTALPPRQNKPAQSILGESQAVKEVQELTQEDSDKTEMSGALAPVAISGAAAQSLQSEAQTNKNTRPEDNKHSSGAGGSDDNEKTKRNLK